MKRLLALILVALTFAFTSVAPVSHAAAKVVGAETTDTTKPETALDAKIADEKVAKVDAKATKVKKHKAKAKQLKQAKKDAKEANDAAAKEVTATKDAAKDAAKKDAGK